MKKKFSKILGIGLTLALLTSLLLTAAPVSALTQPTVDVDPDEISPAEGEYEINFAITEELDVDATITVRFPDDTAVADVPTVEILAWHRDGGGILRYEDVDNVTATGDDDTREVVIEWDTDTITTLGFVRVTFTAGITNPTDPGDYTLEVKTSEETDYVESASYEIIAPIVGGFIYVYNSANILLATFGGREALGDVETAGYYAVDDVIIQVGPGTFVLNTTTDNVVLSGEGITFKSSAGAEDTIIAVDAALNKDAIQITGDEVTVDGFTIQDTEDTYTAIKVTGDDATVIDNIFTADDGYPEGISVEASAAGATVSGNELDIYHTMMVQNTASDCTLSDNSFGAGINLHNTPSDITITGNTLMGSELWGIVLWTGGTYTDILIEGNTISETTEGAAIGICVQGTAEVDNLRILDNDITDNEGVGILIESGVTIATDSAIAIMFNTITGNDADNDGYGIQNDSDADVDAPLNWWGTAVADDVGDMVNDTDDGDTDYKPFLADTAEAVFSATDVVVEAASLDAEDEVGVKVSGATGANIIAVAKYINNPQGAKGDAIAFWDVYVVGATADPTIKFYAGNDDSELYIWSADTEHWSELTCSFSDFGGYAYATIDRDLLDMTPFVLVAVEPAAEEIDAPAIAAPENGADDVSLTPTFSWGAVADADGYYFEFADNANFVTPMVKLDGDLARLIVTAYAYRTELPYSTAYYWRVKAVSGTEDAGDLAESGWASAVFITMAEPVEPTPPVVIEPTPPAPPAPIITIEQPDIVVPLPTVTEITPAWIYVIIGVGAVLVIALIVLVVRTRRVA